MIPPRIKAKVTSPADKGGNKISTILPCILEIIKDDEVLANAFCMICIAIKPGTKKVVNLCPSTSVLSEPIANVNTVKNNNKVTMGEMTVCCQTLKNL